MKESLYAIVVMMLLVMALAVSCYVKDVSVAMPVRKINIMNYDINHGGIINKSK